MGKDSYAVRFAAFGLIAAWTGCAALSSGPIKEPTPDINRPAAARSATMPQDRGEAVPAVAYDQGDDAAIRQTAGFWEDPVGAMKRRADKAAQPATPSTPAQPTNDPTLLATKANPRPELFIAAAQVHEQSGRITEAEQAFQQAFHMSPNYLATQLAYARFKDRQRQSREALEMYQRAAKDHPTDASVFNDLGLFYARRGMNNEAFASFERATQLEPRKPLYRNNIAMVLVDTNRPEAAMPHLLAVYTEADACYKMGYLLQKKGQRDLAMDYFAKALRLNPSMAEAKAWYEYLRSQPSPVAQTPAGPERAVRSSEEPAAAAQRDEPPARVAARPAPPSASPPADEEKRPEVKPLPPTPGPTAPSRVTPPAKPERLPPPVQDLPPVPKRLPETSATGGHLPRSLAADDPPMPPELLLDGQGKTGALHVGGESTDPSKPVQAAFTKSVPAVTGSDDAPDAPLPPPSALLPAK